MIERIKRIVNNQKNSKKYKGLKKLLEKGNEEKIEKLYLNVVEILNNKG